MKKFIAWLSLALIAICIVPFGAFQTKALDTPYKLSGIWQWNNIINQPTNAGVGAAINFTTNAAGIGTQYTSITILKTGVIVPNVTYSDGETTTTISSPGGKIINFGNTEQSVTQDFYEFFTANAQPYSVIGTYYSITYTGNINVDNQPARIPTTGNATVTIYPESNQFAYVQGSTINITGAEFTTPQVIVDSNGLIGYTIKLSNATDDIVINTKFATNPAWTASQIELNNKYNQGYNDGVAASEGEPWKELFSAPIEATVNTFTAMLNFNILGVNLSDVFWGLFTLGLFTAIMGVILKWKLGG